MNEMIITNLMVFTGLMATLGCVTRVVLARIHRRRELPDHVTAAALTDLAQRLERIEQGVEGTAVEIERLAEGQRFTAKLLAERGRVAVAGEAARGRVVTPH
jgi:hypothetical protein